METETWLSLYDKKKLTIIAEIYPELYISEGLFLPKEQAWLGIRDFFQKGEKSNELKWITPNKLPDEANWC